jgi:pilus assembly protein CpaC
VSDIDAARSVTVGGFVVPGLTSRQSETTVRLSDGQSFAIAGLLSDRMRQQVDKIPILGDVPILGALFRSVSYRRDESELLVVITARLTKPVAPHDLPRLPTEDEQNDPNDFELFLLGGFGTGTPEREETDKSGKKKAEAGAPRRAASLGLGSKYAGRGPSGELGFIR